MTCLNRAGIDGKTVTYLQLNSTYSTYKKSFIMKDLLYWTDYLFPIDNLEYIAGLAILKFGYNEEISRSLRISLQIEVYNASY